MNDRKPASAREYLAPPQGKRAPVTRQTFGMTLIIVPAMFGAFALYRLGVDQGDRLWIATIALVCGAIGGWIHHPVRRFRVKGAMAGILAAAGALVVTYYYVEWRGGDQKFKVFEELLIPIAIGAAPGVFVYYSLLKEEQVGPWEDPLARNE